MNAAAASLILSLLGILSWLVDLCELLVVISVVLSWLVRFDVINIRNRMVGQIVGGLNQVTDRLLFPIRRFVPGFAGLDISPLLFFVLAEVVKALIQSARVLVVTQMGGGY